MQREERYAQGGEVRSGWPAPGLVWKQAPRRGTLHDPKMIRSGAATRSITRAAAEIRREVSVESELQNRSISELGRYASGRSPRQASRVGL